MGFQQKLVQIEPFLAVEVLREGYAPAHIADGRGEVAPGDAEGVGPASGFGGELRLVHGADGPEQGIQRSAERFLHHPGGERRLQGLRIRTFFRGGGCGPGGFGSPRGLRMYVGGGRFFIREVGEFKAFRLGGKRREAFERRFGSLGSSSQFQRGDARPAGLGVPCAAVRSGERLRAWAERGEQGAQGQSGQGDQADHARRHEAVQRVGQQADERFGEQAGKRKQRQHTQRRQDTDKKEAFRAGKPAGTGREGAGQEQKHEQGPQRQELQRPRVDITGRISSLFRDTLPGAVCWLDKAVKMVAELDESFEDNFVRKHIIEESQRLESEGVDAASAWKQASYRLFGDPPGAHGAGVSALLAARNWENIDDIAQVYVRWGGHVYGEGEKGAYRPDLFTQRMSKLEITLSNIDNRESNLLNSDDYNSYRGGMIAAVRSIKGEMPKNYCSDSSDRQHVVIRTLDEEVKRLFRGEAINPKYINGMKEFGYKGAGDLATYVDHCFQWDATSDVMEDWMYEKFAEKYALDKDMQDWFNQVNPWALQRIAAVLLEAEQRNLWDAKPETKAELQKLYLSMEGELEERSDKISE